MDQNPRTAGRLELYQGIANMAPNGVDDGGLWVLSGSHKLHDQFFASSGIRKRGDHGESYNFRAEEAAWYTKNGCKEVKVCAGKGDFISECTVKSTLTHSLGLEDYPLEHLAVWDTDAICVLRVPSAEVEDE